MVTLPQFPEPLVGDGVQLRLAAERDIPEILIAHQDDPSLFARLRLARPPSGAELGRRAELAETERILGAGLWLTVLVEGSDECAGQIDVRELEPQYARAELDLWIVPQRRRCGLGSAALALAARWLVEQAALARLQLLIEPDNQAMLATAASAGFQREGNLRGYWRTPRGRADADVWSLITPDLTSASRS